MGRGLLILVSGLIIIVGFIQKSVSERLSFIPQRTFNYHHEMDVQNISNSLMELGVRELEKDQDWQAGSSQSNFMGANAELEVFTYSDYTNNDPNIPSNHDIEDWDQYTVLLVSTAETQQAKAVTEVAVTKHSFSKYTYFTDYEPSNIYFFDDDVLDGPVHTNGQLRIAGSPTFKGFVSSPNMWEGHSSYDNDPEFEAGSYFNSQEIEMPGSDKLQLLKDEGMNGGLTFNNEISVEFNNNGTVDIAERQGNNWQSPVNYDLDNYNGVISSSEKVYAKGTLKGQATLHSAEEIEIMGDLTYSSNPQNNSNSSDLLGIVSEGNVVVDNEAHEDSGSQDLEIHASIMTLDKSFEVEDYSSGSPRGTLTLVGGLQQQERGPVGTFSGGSVQSGFNKSYSYDDRLAQTFPPFYPRVSTFSQVYWKEKPVQFL